MSLRWTAGIRRLRGRRLHPIALAPWVLVAILVHLGIVLTLWVWRPHLGPPGESIYAVALQTSENPFRSRPEDPAPGGPPEPRRTPDVSSPRPSADKTSSADVRSPSAEEVVSDARPSGKRESTTDDRSHRYGNRSGTGRAEALDHFGGSGETEAAVEGGLRWLAAHRRQDGAWDRLEFERRCPELDRCGGRAVAARELDAAPGLTGLSLLAFLGAGNTHERGAFQDQVTLGLSYLLSAQRPDGSYATVDSLETYNHAIATLAVAECYAMTGDPSLRSSLVAAARQLVESQQVGGGWDYTSDPTTGRSDMSVTGWVMMALKSASVGGIAIPDAALLGVSDFVIRATTREGHVAYAYTARGEVVDNAAESSSRRYGPATTAIAVLIQQLLGWRPNAPVLTRQTDLLLSELPDLQAFHGGDPSGLHSMYYWYYGTLATFNQGGSAWTTWNERLKQTLLNAQDQSEDGRGRARHASGSWEPYGRGWGKWGRTGSRIYTTALSVLMLESYYRYEPAFLSSPGLITESTLRSGLADPKRAGPTTIAIVATNLSAAVGEPVLADLLSVADAQLRLRAAIGLTYHGSPLGRTLLEEARSRVTEGRAVIEDALRRLDRLTWPDRYGRVVRVDEEHGVVIFDTGGRPVYFRQPLRIEHNGRTVARLHVTRRLDEHALAAGKLIEGDSPSMAVEVGDEVVSTSP